MLVASATDKESGQVSVRKVSNRKVSAGNVFVGKVSVEMYIVKRDVLHPQNVRKGYNMGIRSKRRCPKCLYPKNNMPKHEYGLNINVQKVDID